MPDNTGEIRQPPQPFSCRSCGAMAWAPIGAAQPILSVKCLNCRHVEWISFLKEEWVDYVIPFLPATPPALWPVS